MIATGSGLQADLLPNREHSIIADGKTTSTPPAKRKGKGKRLFCRGTFQVKRLKRDQSERHLNLCSLLSRVLVQRGADCFRCLLYGLHCVTAAGHLGPPGRERLGSQMNRIRRTMSIWDPFLFEPAESAAYSVHASYLGMLAPRR